MRMMEQRFTGRLAERREIADQTISFRIKLDKPFPFRAGQYAKVRIMDDSLPEGQRSRSFSIASPPEENRSLLFATRNTGSDFKRYVAGAEEGSEMIVDGPRGSFVLDKEDRRPAVFVTGGIGVTPVRSIIEHAYRKGAARNIHLFLSNRTSSNSPFKNEITSFAEATGGIDVKHVLTGGDKSRRITAEKVRDELGNEFEKALFYICGPPALVSSIRKSFTDSGVSYERMKLEGFTGY